MGLKATVLGASGYSGSELLRWLDRHPAIEVVAVGAGANAGRPVSEVLPHLVAGDLTLQPVDEAAACSADVLFSCLPPSHLPPESNATTVVDLSDGYRADPAWVYGLTEFHRDEVRGATRIANPGCYPTASLLCLAPFTAAGLIEGPLVIDALSGTTGAGRKSEDHLLHAAIDGNAAAYGGVDHRHIAEIERGLTTDGGAEVTVSFTPHLVPMSRGVLVTARGRLSRSISDAEAIEVLKEAYSSEPFIHVIPGWPATKSVLGSNHAVVSARVDERAGFLVCSAAIDNLGKGAAGQAVQNANLMLGLEETTGLIGGGLWP